MSNTGLFFFVAIGFCLSYYIGSRSSSSSSSVDLNSCYKINLSEEKSTLNLSSPSSSSSEDILVTNVTSLDGNVVENPKNATTEKGEEFGSSNGTEFGDPSAVLSFFTAFNRKCNVTIPSSEARATVIKWGFAGENPFSNFPPEGIKPLLRKKLVRGWDSTENVFKNLILETKPEVVLELGSFLGASAIHIANVSKELGFNPQIFCIDDFRGWLDLTLVPKINGHSMLLYQFMQNVKFFGFEDNIMPLPVSVSIGTLNLCHWGIKADLIEVDASHDFHSVWMDLHMAHVLLSPKGVMFGHDIVKSEVKRAVKLFAELNGYMVERQGKHWVYRKKKS